MAAYISFGINAQDLLSAVIMTAPGTILVAKMLVPETQQPRHRRHRPHAARRRAPQRKPPRRHRPRHHRRRPARLQRRHHAHQLPRPGRPAQRRYASAISNTLWAHGHIPFPHSLNAVLGVIGAPVAWLIGIPWHEAQFVGNLLGTRTVLNEFIAFTQLGAQKATLAPRTFSIATFALCGFANLGSIGMQIGGIGALIPATPQRPRPPRPPRHARRHHGQPYERLHRQPASPLTQAHPTRIGSGTRVRHPNNVSRPPTTSTPQVRDTHVVQPPCLHNSPGNTPPAVPPM